MKVFLPLTITPTGGTSSFARKFQIGMAKRGHTVIFEPDGPYDALLVAASCRPCYLWQAWRNKVPIIQRLDGVYYPQSVAGYTYPLHNAPLQLIHNYLAVAIIYQSRYSRYCAQRFLGSSKAARTQIIYNGVDTTRFSPAGVATSFRQNVGEHVFITWSRFRRTDQIFPLLRAMETYRDRYTKNCRLVIAGDFSHRVRYLPEQLRRLPYVRYLGVIPNDQLPLIARGADAFLFTHSNPPCPNNVLEAMACGLPVCGVADGAMPEITHEGHTGELVSVNGDGFYAARQFNAAGFAENLHLVMTRPLEYGAAGRQAAVKDFSLERMVENYAQVLQSVV